MTPFDDRLFARRGHETTDTGPIRDAETLPDARSDEIVPEDGASTVAGVGAAGAEAADARAAGVGVTEPLAPDSGVRGEPVDAMPVLVEARTLIPTGGALPAVQAAAVAATSFVAGAATLALVRRHSARRLARARPSRGRALDALPIVGSRTFIVDVHLLGKPGE